jgi:guanine deaminase
MDCNNQEKFMLMAIEKAVEGIKNGQAPFGACIVKDGDVLSCEHNTVWQTTDITAHAEINAIRQVCKNLCVIDLRGCTIYSTCEPCPMCFGACHWAKIDRIVYGVSIADAKTLGFFELSIPNETMKRLGLSPVKITKDFLREKNLELFKFWVHQKDKRTY